MNKQVAINELEYAKIKLEEAKEANVFVSPSTDIAINMAIEALQKSIPKPPKKDSEDDLLCPLCGEDVDWHKYCEECGQAIKWE